MRKLLLLATLALVSCKTQQYSKQYGKLLCADTYLLEDSLGVGTMTTFNYVLMRRLEYDTSWKLVFKSVTSTGRFNYAVYKRGFIL